MKDINQLKNYRLKYKRYYKIDFGSEYAIHHIDFNRKNNDISNLLLLPNDLHSKYHTYKSQFDAITENGLCLKLDYSSGMLLNMQLSYLDDLLKVLKDIDYWVELKYLVDNGYQKYENIIKGDKNVSI